MFSLFKEKRKRCEEKAWEADRGTILTATDLNCASIDYLAQVAGDSDIMPSVIVELAIDWLHQGLKGPRAQVDDQPDRTTLQRKIHIVCRLAGVQHEAVALQRSEGKRDLVSAALDRCQGQVVAEELVAFEGGY